MLPGMVLGSGKRTLRFGSTPLPAMAGESPSDARLDTLRKPRMMVPKGEPPSTVCTCPVSSSTSMAANCTSSLGITSTLRNSSG